MTEPHEVAPTAEAALDRVRRELLAAKLSDKNLVRSLRSKESRRQTYATGEVVRTMVTRNMAVGEEPLRTPPASVSVGVALWGPAWPPQSESELISRNIDIRQSYEIVPCPRCSAAGRNRCGVCGGSGQAPDPRNPGRAVPCTICRGQGTVSCAQCEGHGRLNRFMRIVQTVTTQKTILEGPDGCFGVPKTHPSGQLAIDEPLGFGTAEDAGNAVTSAASELNSDRADELAQEMFDPEAPVNVPIRLGWMRLRARWYDGWELICTAGGKRRSYFVPDTSAGFIGPRLQSSAKIASLAAVMLGTLVVIGAGLSYRATQEREAQESASAAEAQRQIAEKEARIQALISEVPAAVQEIDTALDVTALGTVQDASLKERELTTLSGNLSRFGELQPTPPAIAERQAKLARTIDVLKGFQQTVLAANEAIAATQAGDERATAGAWLEADDLYVKAIDLWSKHPDMMAALKMPDKNGKPTNINSVAEVANVERKRQRIALNVGRERTRIEAATRKGEQEKAAAEALAALCGQKPICGGWDGECVGIESALKRVAHDPDSIDVESCTDPVLTKDNCWVTSCNVRGKNAFGALILNRKRFSLSALGVSEL